MAFCPCQTAQLLVQIQGIELGVVNAPLHFVYLNSNLVNGALTVGIRPTIPVEGISLTLGNDLVGSKVMNDPYPEQIVDNCDDIFPVCAVTRASARRARTDDSDNR